MSRKDGGSALGRTRLDLLQKALHLKPFPQARPTPRPIHGINALLGHRDFRSRLRLSRASGFYFDLAASAVPRANWSQ